MIHLFFTAAVVLAPVRVTTAPEVDGRLDDAAWAEALPFDAFVQKFPEEGQAPGELTTVRVVYDQRAVYVGIDCVQQASPVVAHLTRRDREVESDHVDVDLDTRGDGRSAFHFEVNAAGVLVDGVRYDDTELSLDWDENWEARTQRTATGWSAEIMIPLRILRFSGASPQSWGLQVRRYVSGRQEVDELAFIPRAEAGEVSRYATVGPFEALEHGRPIELRPFATGSFRHADAVDGEPAANTPDGSVGVDAKWHVTQQLSLDASINPDFAQVEADQVVLNLSNYELELPEKRPFFLEGADELATPVGLVYTRRIGVQPIRGALKLVGTPGAGVRVAVLSAITDAAPMVDAPAAVFGVVRVRRAVGAGADVGVLATSALGFDQVTAHDAYSVGVDGRWRSPGGAFVVEGQVAGTYIDGGPARVLADGTVVKSGDVAPAGMVRVAKQAGTWRFDALYEGYGRRFDPNDVGFLERQDVHHVSLDLEQNDSRPGRWLLSSRRRIELFRRWNLDGLSLSEGYQINDSGQFHNFWSYFVELHYRAAHYDDREFGDGVALERAGLLGLELWLTSDPRRRVSASFGTTAQWLANGVNVVIEGEVTLRLLPQFDLELLPSMGYSAGEPRSVGLEGAGYLVGDLEAKQVGVTVRATYTFTPRLTLQTYVQGFVAAVRFSDFASAAPDGARTIALGRLAPSAAPAENPDFQQGVLEANMVLRWEWQLGSTAFLVYTRTQVPDVALVPGERPRLDLGSVARGPAVDTVLLKIAYWWG